MRIFGCYDLIFSSYDTVEVNEALNATIQCVTQGNQLHENVSKVD